MNDNTQNEVPLIWTTKGNLPESSLRFEHLWEDTEDYIALALNYYLEDELVKSSKHVYSKKSFDLFPEQATF